jgi:asparagine synthase (glutamine-hydrolysing)
MIKDKYILRKLAYKRVSQELLDRPKKGFAVPLERWLRNELRQLVSDLITPSQLEAIGIRNTSMVMTFLHEHLSGQRDHVFRLWPLLALALWYREQTLATV